MILQHQDGGARSNLSATAAEFAILCGRLSYKCRLNYVCATVDNLRLYSYNSLVSRENDNKVGLKEMDDRVSFVPLLNFNLFVNITLLYSKNF